MARGHYRILLGMAAGVGKTYRMLLEGRQAQEEGRDVVIGYLEPHDRPETTVLAEGLEVVPRLRARQGAVELEEMDVDAVIRARAAARADRRARAHERGGDAEREALAGHRGGARRRHRRHLDRQRPASREPQRRDLRADRRARARDVPRPDPRPGGRGDPRRPHAGGAAGAPARRQGLSGRPRGGRARELLPRGQARRAAGARAARGRRGRRRRGEPHACSSRSASRPSPSACSRSSSRSRSRSGSCAGPGARRSGSAPSWTPSGCGRRGGRPTPEEATQLAALRRLAGILGAHFIEEEGDDLVDTVRRVAAERGSTYLFVGTPDESRRREILGGSLLSRMVRELPGVDIRVVANRADRRGLERT